MYQIKNSIQYEKINKFAHLEASIKSYRFNKQQYQDSAHSAKTEIFFLYQLDIELKTKSLLTQPNNVLPLYSPTCNVFTSTNPTSTHFPTRCCTGTSVLTVLVGDILVKFVLDELTLSKNMQHHRSSLCNVQFSMAKTVLSFYCPQMDMIMAAT